MKKISIGKRNLKTAASVFLAIGLFLILVLIDKATGNSGDGYSGLSGIYTPFFAGIAAAYTSHKDYKSSLKQAKIRSVGSVIGGLYGMIIILIVEYMFLELFAINDFVLYHLVEYTIVSIGIVFLIYTNVKTKQTDATFISCLTYLSVTISIRNGGMPIIQFAANRILSTLIGVGIALLVNNIRIFNFRNKAILFLANIDDVINYDDYPLSFTRYKINDLYQKDAKLILNTKNRGFDKDLFKDVHINKPLILMDGVCIYDHSKKEYIYSCDFTYESKHVLNSYLKENNYDYFTYVINDLKLVVFHLDLKYEASKKYYKNERNINRYPFVYAPLLDSCDVALYEVVVKKEETNNLENDLKKLHIYDDIIIEKVELDDEFVLVIIKPNHSSRLEAFMHLPYYENAQYKVAFLSNINDLKIAQLADFSICLENSDQQLKDACDYIVCSNDFNDVLKLFAKLFYSKNTKNLFKKMIRRNKKCNLKK